MAERKSICQGMGGNNKPHMRHAPHGKRSSRLSRWEMSWRVYEPDLHSHLPPSQDRLGVHQNQAELRRGECAMESGWVPCQPTNRLIESSLGPNPAVPEFRFPVDLRVNKFLTSGYQAN